jgi:hypothetical protein
MNLLELLHNEKIVKSLEKVDSELKTIKNSEGVSMISPKTILLVEFILNRAGIVERSDIMFDLLKFITIDKKGRKNGNK